MNASPIDAARARKAAAGQRPAGSLRAFAARANRKSGRAGAIALEEGSVVDAALPAAPAISTFERTYPRYPRYPQAESRDLPLRESDSPGMVRFRGEGRTSGDGRKFRSAATAEAGGVLRDASHRSSGWVFEGEV